MRRKGQAFTVVVLIFALIMSVFATSISTAMRSHALEETEIYQREQALYVAQMGINEMIYNVNNGTAYTNGQYITGTSPSGIGTYKATYITPDSSGYGGSATIRGEGTVEKFTRAIYVSLDNPLLKPVMVYAKANGDPTPYYRIWDGSSWGSELAANSVGIGVRSIQYLVLRFAQTRREAILGILDSTGAITIQIYDGTSWSSTMLVGNTTTANAGYRGFDIEYESSGDRAIIVYGDNTSMPKYRIWNGVSLSPGVGQNGLPMTVTVPTTGIPRWIEMTPHPSLTSNEIAMAYADSNNDIYGMRWTGSAWDNMGVSIAWDASIASSARQCFDVAYESLTGKAMFIWGDATATDQYYRTWNGTTLTSPPTLLDIPAAGGVSEWVRLAPRPNSNELMYGVQDAGLDLNTRKWSGSAWDTVAQHPEHDGSTENRESRNFDLVYETYPSNSGVAWLVWGDGSSLSRRTWNGTSWSSITSVGDDTAFVKLIADPITGNVLSAVYGDISAAATYRQIFASQLTGGGSTWSSYLPIWAGPTVAQPVMERVTIATGKSTTTIGVKPFSYREEY
ncbi:MAG: hypothetical protein NT102_02245 [Caldiserica bacterium]|nr:hypothetical protein [Caldisericota bacterium]